MRTQLHLDLYDFPNTKKERSIYKRFTLLVLYTLSRAISHPGMKMNLLSVQYDNIMVQSLVV